MFGRVLNIPLTAEVYWQLFVNQKISPFSQSVLIEFSLQIVQRDSHSLISEIIEDIDKTTNFVLRGYFQFI